MDIGTLVWASGCCFSSVVRKVVAAVGKLKNTPEQTEEQYRAGQRALAALHIVCVHMENKRLTAEVATCSDDGTTRLWHLDTGSGQRLRSPGGCGRILGVAWSPDASTLATCSTHHAARIWDLASGRCLLELQELSDWSNVKGVAWSPDGRQLLTISGQAAGGGCAGQAAAAMEAMVWDVATGCCSVTLRGHAGGISCVAWSPDGTMLVTGSWDATAKVWEAVGGRCMRTLEGHSRRVSSAGWSPDGRRLATGSNDGTARVWEVGTGRCVQTLQGCGPFGYHWTAVAWSPDGRRLATGSGGCAAKVWDVASWQCDRVLEGHSGHVCGVGWSPDGRRLVTGSRDHTAKVWDVGRGGCVKTLEGHTDCVLGVSWRPTKTCNTNEVY